MVVTKQKFSPLRSVGLDISNVGFLKLHVKESKYEDDKKKYNLDPEKFKRFADELILKMHHITAIKECTTRSPTPASGAALKYMLHRE